MKIKELEEKVKENQRLKESVENEKELWRNKANNLARSSAMNKPELLSQYNKKWTTPTKQEINEMNFIPRKTETINKINFPINDISPSKSNKKSEYNSAINPTIFSSDKNGIKENENRHRISVNVNPFLNTKNPYAEKQTEKAEDYSPENNNIRNNKELNEGNKRQENHNNSSGFVSEDSDHDNSYEEPEDRIDPRKIKNKKVVVSEINSDVENISQKQEISDNTSMTESFTECSTKQEVITSLNQNKICESIMRNDPNKQKEKARYMQFLKIFLKMKFQKLHNSHLGQQIPAKPVYELANEKNISTKEWQDFILSEIQQPHKYAKFIKLDKTKNKNRNSDQTNNNNADKSGKNLEIIDEE